MEFTPTYNYLVTLLSQAGSEEESRRFVEEAIRSAMLPKKIDYEIDDFIKICEELRKKGGRVGVVATASITQARCFRILKKEEEFRKKRKEF
jgi:hypothetical protein